jgi:hypothetical protein
LAFAGRAKATKKPSSRREMQQRVQKSDAVRDRP